MVVKKKPVVKKRKVKKGKTTKTLTKSGMGGNVSQVVNVYVSKATRQRRASAPKQFTPAIQPQMYNAGQENMILGLRQQNKTLMDILNKQSKTDTTPNSDIQSLENLVVKKLDGNEPREIPERDENADYGGVAPINPKYTIPKPSKSSPSLDTSTIPKPSKSIKSQSLDTTSRQNVSNMLSSIAEGMDEIPQGNEIKNKILAIGDQVRPLPQELTGIRVRIAEIDDLDELSKLENEYGNLLRELQSQSTTDKAIKMSKYVNKTSANKLPKKISTLKSLVNVMKQDLERSISRMGDEALAYILNLDDDTEQTSFV